MPAIHRPLETRHRFLALFGSDPVPVRTALAAGFTRAQLRAAVETGQLWRVRHGVLSAHVPTSAGVASADAARTDHLHRLRAALHAVGPGAMASDVSAAALLDVSTPEPGSFGTVVLVQPGAANFDGPGLRVRGSKVPAEHRTVVDGIPTTTVVRTAVDLARGRPLPAALIPLDDAARRIVAGCEQRSWRVRALVHDASRRAAALDDLAAAVEGCSRWPGIAAVRRALAHVDPASESPLESRSRGWFVEAGLPALEIGRRLETPSGSVWVDFCDPVRRVVGEADGWAKYGSDMDAVRRAIEAEKRRQAEIENDGWRVVRWTSRDGRAAVVSRMSAALGPT